MTEECQAANKDLPFVVLIEEKIDPQDEGNDAHKEIRVGDICPHCRRGHLGYNGLLNLECDHCRYTLAGCST